MGELRIIAGEFRRRRIAAPPTEATRPITDRVREALFSRLGDRLDGAAVLDVFAGGGTMGLEALSRGAARCAFIERAPAALRTLRNNIASLGVGERCDVIRADVLKGLPAGRLSSSVPFAVTFFDPPYAMWDDPQTAARLREVIERAASEGLLAAGAVWITRTGARSVVEPPGGFALSDRRAYGRMVLWWFQRSAPQACDG